MVDTSLLTDYSWADIAKAAKVAMMNAAVGGNQLVINGRSIQRITIEDAKKLYELAQQNLADESGGGIGLVQFGER